MPKKSDKKKPPASKPKRRTHITVPRRKSNAKEQAVTNHGEVVLYRAEDGSTALDVRLDGDTVWLSQAQMVTLFQRDQSVLSRHLRNVFAEGELEKKSNMQKMHITNSDKPTVLYSLDVIISVGYRVKSKRGTQFRIWATRTLKDHLIKGYTLHKRRLRTRGVAELEQTIQLLSRTLTNQALITEQGQGVLDIVTRYARSWLLLQQYDENQLALPAQRHAARTVLDIAHARAAIQQLKQNLIARREASDLFGRERGDQLEAILGNLEQTFGGTALYASIEEKAAHLLYFLIKDHPFADGNKRIGSFLFILYLDENAYLNNANGTPRIHDNTLVALALLIAESQPVNKELMIRLVMNLLN